MLPPPISVQSPSPAWHISRLLRNATTEHPSLQHRRPSHALPWPLSMGGPTIHPSFCFAPSKEALCYLEHSRNTFYAQAQAYNLPTQPRPSFDALLQDHLTPRVGNSSLSQLAGCIEDFSTCASVRATRSACRAFPEDAWPFLAEEDCAERGGTHVPQPCESTIPFNISGSECAQTPEWMFLPSR